MRKVIVFLLILAVSGVASAISLYPDVQVTAGQKIRGAWAVIIASYYGGEPGLAPLDPDLRALIDPLTLDWTSTAAWPDVSAMNSHFNQNPRHPTKLREWFIKYKKRVEGEIAQAAMSDPGADWDGS